MRKGLKSLIISTVAIGFVVAPPEWIYTRVFLQSIDNYLKRYEPVAMAIKWEEATENKGGRYVIYYGYDRNLDKKIDEIRSSEGRVYMPNNTKVADISLLFER